MSSATKARLQSDVLTVTTAAAQGRPAAARSALAVLQADVAAASAAGHLGDGKRAEIEAIIARVEADLAAATQPPAPTETTAPPRESPKKQPKKHDSNNGGDNEDG